MKVGQRVNFSIRKIQDFYRSSDSELTVSWRLVNDVHGAAAVLQGPENSWSWNGLRAGFAGVHHIEATIRVDGEILERVTFAQVVEKGDAGYSDLTNADPTPINNMGDFIKLVERIEAAYPGYTWQDVTTKIRKQFYPGHIDTEKGLFKAAFMWDDLIDEQQHIEPLQSPPCRIEDIAALKTDLIIGGRDLGHVLTGIDSMNFPDTAGIFSMVKVSGAAAATWSGDVGSALVYWANRAGFSDPSGLRREEFYNQYTSMDDLLGDLDGINLADLPSLKADAPLSARLQRYYQMNSKESSNRRTHRFCQLSGFQIENGKLSGSARAYIRLEVDRFSRAYNTREGALGDAFLMMGSHSLPIKANSYEFTTSHEMAKNLDWFVERFIHDIEAGLAKE